VQEFQNQQRHNTAIRSNKMAVTMHKAVGFLEKSVANNDSAPFVTANTASRQRSAHVAQKSLING
jgi:hypothetical protein